MKWHIRIIRELLTILRAAIAEIREHNGDYHHITPGPWIVEWEEFIEKVEGEL